MPTGAEYAGTGHAELTFQNRGDGVGDLTAAGRIQIRDGDLGDLPIVANIFALGGNVLGVDQPPRFERADIRFTLADEVVTFQQLHLAGPLFDMPGTGIVDLGGYVDLVFRADFIKSMLFPGLLQFPAVGTVVGALLREDFLYAIRIRGDIDTVEPEVIAFPGLGVFEGTEFEGAGVPDPPARRVPRWFR